MKSKEMNYTTILKKSESALLWLYKNITNKFTNVFTKLEDRFPILNRYPLLKYCLIPLFIAMFILLRFIMEFGINELAIWSSRFVRETSGISVSERVIVLSIVAVIISLRIGLRFRSKKKKNANELEMSYEIQNNSWRNIKWKQISRRKTRIWGESHENIINIAEKLKQHPDFSNNEAASLGIGLKWFTCVMLKNKEIPLFKNKMEYEITRGK